MLRIPNSTDKRHRTGKNKKLVFLKEQAENANLYILNKQNNDQVRIMYKIQFCSPFKNSIMRFVFLIFKETNMWESVYVVDAREQLRTLKGRKCLRKL